MNGNIYKAYWDTSGSDCYYVGPYEKYSPPTHVVGQLDDSVDSLLIEQTDIPTAAGQYYHVNDTIYVWLYGDGNPSADSITIEASCGYAVLCLSGVSHTRIWGFKLRYGNGANVRYNCECDSNYVEHCTMSRIAGASGWNTGFVYSGDCGGGNNRDSSEARFGNIVRACSLLWEVYEPGQSHAFALVYYNNWDALVESCYVKGNYGNAAIHFKSNNFFPVIRHNYIDGTVMSGGSAILLTGDYDYAQVYGNIIVGNGDHPDDGIHLRAASGTEGDTSTYSRGIVVQNNTLINIGDIAFYNSEYGWGPEDSTWYHVGENYWRYNVVYHVPGASSYGICRIFWNNVNTCFLDSNMYYVPTGYNFQANIFGENYNWGQWQSVFGFDVNSSAGVDPGFANPSGGNYFRPYASNEMFWIYPNDDTATIFGALQNDTPGHYLNQSLTAVDKDTSTITIRNYYISIGVTVDTTEYQWSTDNFSSFAGKDTVAVPPNPDTVLIDNLIPNTLYYIRAISWDTSEGIFDTSSTLLDSTLQFPMIPTPDTFGTSIDSSLSFALGYASAVEAGIPIFYEFELDTLINFPAPRLVLPFSVTDTVIATFDNLFSGVEYRWRVRAIASLDTSFFSDWSPVAIFSLGAVAAGEECIGIFPSEGITIDTLTPTFEASCEDANNYIYFQVDDNINFDSPIESGPIAIAANITASWQISEPLSNENIYFWRAGTDNLEWFYPISFRVAIDMYAYPVPFRAQEGHSSITFTNLPEGSRITIMTVSENIVKISEKVDSGGNWIWDVKNERGNELAPGVYLYAIEFPSGTSRGKLMVIR